MKSRKTLMASGGLVLVACLFGQGCPGGIGTTLVDQRSSCTVELDGNCRVRVNFTPTAVGRTVRITVTGSTNESRPVFGVDDANGNTVANFPNAVSNTVTDSFVVQSATVHFLTVRETAATLATYDILVVQN
ncbi:MAG: hypothetical protein GXY44_09055 [Phycisphaerales bacterium]|nr:hypothetical protein [Phycisphaerales bacterium]